MKNWSKISEVLVIGAMLVAAGGAFAATADETTAGTIQAIQQASDPSAAVAAYANGTATARNNPKIYAAYINKMTELGLPELAYHQAEYLTGLESNNGLGWGVIAYVDARRGQMPEAISAIVLAGQFAPENAFVQRTAGELAAWYDLKAEKSTLSENTKDGIAKVRALLNKRTAFTDAYSTASKAYQSQTSTTQPAQSSVSPSTGPAQPQSYSEQPQGSYYAGPAYDYAAQPSYPDYGPYYDYGAGWVEPAPLWWWQPVGFFGGFEFFPFASVVVFDRDHDRFHHHFHDGRFHDGSFDHRDAFFHANKNGGRFFGSPVRPTFATRTSDASRFHGTAAVTVRNSSPMGTSRGTTPAFTSPGMTMNRGTTMNRSFTQTMPTRTWNNGPVFGNTPGGGFQGGGGFHGGGGTAMGGGHGGGFGGGHGGGMGGGHGGR
jgi:hypothetical protein